MIQEFEAYLSLDPRRYEGHWIAHLGEEIVARGRSLREVHAEALRKHPGKSPLFTKVPESDETQIF